MPELPEVETVKRSLSPLMINTVICGAKIRCAKLREIIDQESMNHLLNEAENARQVVSIERRAKYLIISFSGGYSMLIHFGMSGLIKTQQIKNKSFDIASFDEYDRHDHIIFYFIQPDNLKSFCYIRMIYNDVRRFGMIKVYKTANIYASKELSKLGIEPLMDDFNASYLKNKFICLNSDAKIKLAIMNNKIVVGIGNIYASESLFLANIRPDRAIGSLSSDEIIKLVACIKHVLCKAITLGGSSIRDFANCDGTVGSCQTTHNVYGRAKLKCVICNQIILSIILGQRNSFYCPNCQK